MQKIFWSAQPANIDQFVEFVSNSVPTNVPSNASSLKMTFYIYGSNSERKASITYIYRKSQMPQNSPTTEHQYFILYPNLSNKTEAIELKQTKNKQTYSWEVLLEATNVSSNNIKELKKVCDAFRKLHPLPPTVTSEYMSATLRQKKAPPEYQKLFELSPKNPPQQPPREYQNVPQRSLETPTEEIKREYENVRPLLSEKQPNSNPKKSKDDSRFMDRISIQSIVNARQPKKPPSNDTTETPSKQKHSLERRATISGTNYSPK